MVQSTLLRRTRNKLEWPSGLQPGVDPGHFAANNLMFSGVTAHGSAGFLQIYPSLFFGTNTLGSSAFSIKNVTGPTLDCNANTTGALAYTKIRGGTNLLPITIGTIFSCPGASSAPIVYGGTWNSAAIGPVVDTATHLFFFSSSTNFDTGFVFPTNTPFFVAGSVNSGTANVVAKNLITGQTQLFQGSGSFTSSAGVADVELCQTKALISAGMCANNFLSLEALQEWADNPWGFWYPEPKGTAIFEMKGSIIVVNNPFKNYDWPVPYGPIEV